MISTCGPSFARGQIVRTQLYYPNIIFRVPRGSILGHVLFNIYDNNLTKEIQCDDITCSADVIIVAINQDTVQNLEINNHIVLTQIYKFLGNLNVFVNCKRTNLKNFSLLRNGT